MLYKSIVASGSFPMQILTVQWLLNAKYDIWVCLYHNSLLVHLILQAWQSCFNMPLSCWNHPEQISFDIVFSKFPFLALFHIHTTLPFYTDNCWGEEQVSLPTDTSLKTWKEQTFMQMPILFFYPSMWSIFIVLAWIVYWVICPVWLLWCIDAYPMLKKKKKVFKFFFSSFIAWVLFWQN